MSELPTSIKKAAILGLCSGLPDMILKVTVDEKVEWRAQKLKEASVNAIMAAHMKLDRSAMRRTHEVISSAYEEGQTVNVSEVLSLCILGLLDLQHHSGEGTPIDTVLKRAMWFIRLFDPGLTDEESHSEA